MRRISIYLTAVISLFFITCKHGKLSKEDKEALKTFKPSQTPGPHIVVYKTMENYDKLVPVFLNENKTAIVSYPDPKDINLDLLPVKLKKGYLLDKKGIGKNVAFLEYTYEEYSSLQEKPDTATLMQRIKAKMPFSEMCDCGNSYGYKNLEAQLKYWIKEGKLAENCIDLLK